METLDSVWQISIISLVAGIMIGAMAYRLFGPSGKQADKMKTELDEAREDLNSFKADVNQHFNKTSELVNDLTQNYVKVYQHLAEGSQNLGDSKNFNNLLEQHQGRVSIAVDDDTSVTETTADDVLVDPVVTEVVTEATAAEAIDEHAEPFINTQSSATEAADPPHDSTNTEASSPSENPDDPAEAAAEATPRVDTPEAPTDNVKADDTAAEDKDKVKGKTDAP